ncbi:type 1 fimbrial protein [Salmonella enterica subsp. enterica]|nr:type 1 fimbrial protein [Salmonella enterica subsp. enterica]
MQGAIIDTACAIAAGDADQSINMGTLAFSELVKNGRGPAVPLTVRLVNCVLNRTDPHGIDHWKDVHVTFVGEAAGHHRFVLHGNASGGALVIADSNGIEAEPGKPMPAIPITPGSMDLHYRLWLTSNHKKIRPGHLNTTIRYFMEYD